MRYVGSSTTLDINYRYVIEHLIETLRNNQDLSVHIRGHVCCGPSNKISKRRAKNVYKILKRAGISENRISYKGYSDSLPSISPEETEEDEMANRRVDFIIRRQ
jgi:outer membrane protein OmpA-like peptidoglycan-associated protein